MSPLPRWSSFSKTSNRSSIAVASPAIRRSWTSLPPVWPWMTSAGLAPRIPPEAVKSGKVQALTDEDRLTLVRWIDLGCPIDLSKDPARPGWSLDDQRPTLTLTYPRAGSNESVTRILVGMHDYNTELDMKSF